VAINWQAPQAAATQGKLCYRVCQSRWCL